MSITQAETSTHMQQEIFSQPDCWRECLSSLESDPVIAEIIADVHPEAEWLFIGCGTSYYLAVSAAASFSAITGRVARATPASEVLLFPNATMAPNRHTVPVLISRSGHTTEAVKAQEFIRQRGLKTIAVTCDGDSALASGADYSIVLLPAAEQSMVMTRSFSSMLIALQWLAATLTRDQRFVRQLKQLPEVAKPLFETVPPELQEFVHRHCFEDYAFLGQGPFYGIACEAALKVTESSCSYAQSFHSLEFRHGPKSIAGPRTLVGIFISDTGYGAEVNLLEEVKGLGSPTLVVTPKADSRVSAAADIMVEIPTSGAECSRLAACIPWAQLLGLYTGLKKGLNPDTPRNLSKVVVLDEIS